MNEQENVQQPDLEVAVRQGSTEIAVLAFFRASPGAWDVLVGVENPDVRLPLADTFELCRAAVEKATFRRLDSADALRDLHDDLAKLHDEHE